MQTHKVMIDYINARTGEDYILVKEKLIEVMAYTEQQAVEMVKRDIEQHRPRYVGLWYKVTAV